MLARRSDHLLALSVAALIASVIGVQLGRSAIAEINPIHFRGPAPAPRGIDPNAAPPRSEAFAQADVWAQSYRPPHFDCGGDCDAYQARSAALVALEDTVPRARPAAPYWREETPTAEPASWAPGETGPGALSVDRYMHYPVEEAAVEDAPDAGEADKPPVADDDSSRE